MPASPARPSRLVRVFDRQAAAYARRRQRMSPAESRWRRELVSQAEGQVLEVAVGAGANFCWYRPTTQLTAVDLSPAMLAEAERAAIDAGLTVEFRQGSVSELDFPSASFDAIVSTLGLCSYPEPVATLRRMRRWLKPGGRLLALEHGLSWVPPLNAVLYLTDPLQYALLGCHSTRRPVALIRAAGFHITQQRRHLAGLLTQVWAENPTVPE